jgi:chemotaxis family two-component system sensor kinase Cph1
MRPAHEPATMDLSNCDREPIRIPGAIQPHGVLFALSEPELCVVQVSENVDRILGTSTDEVLDRPLSDLLDSVSVQEVRTALSLDRWDDVNPVRILARGVPFDGIVHRHEGAAILELEPVPALSIAPSIHHPLRQALQGIQRAHTLPDLCDSLVRQVQRLTGFERVLVYRFDGDGHGSVEAEVKLEHLDSYLGLRYPASDIPKQARELYLRNWLRIIPDASYAPARIVPPLRPDTGEPLDLAFSVLRSVSPIHLEYMANMGVRASLSASLIVRDRLWGLISCANHSGPRLVPYEARSSTEVLARLASLQVSALEDRQAATQRALRRGTQEALAATMRRSSPNDDVLDALIAQAAEVMALAGADGLAVVGAGEPLTQGRTPPTQVLAEIARWLEERGEGAPFATESLPALLPGVEAEKDTASGLLTVALPGVPRRRLLWFRGEIVQTVNWGGDPRKAVEADPSQRVHPRRSFELWKEEVHLHARPWSPSDVEGAEELRRNAVEIDLARQVLREQQAVRARDDLVAVVSHDLRGPLAVIQMQAALLLRTGIDKEEPSLRLRASAERVQKAVDRMNALIRDLLDLARIEAGRFDVRPRPEGIREIVDEALIIAYPLAEAKRIVIEVEEVSEDGSVAADRERVFQVLANLTGNAIKFTPEGGKIVLRAEARSHEVLFTVADTGPGIPSEQLPHIFDRYWQARRTAHQGTGLGLYIAKGIVEAHGGRIWAESVPGAGARFYFTLPAA